VYLVGFTIGIYYDAHTHEFQKEEIPVARFNSDEWMCELPV
jgi:hypothetical protein